MHPAPTFSDLVASRREWIHNVLKPFCETAARRELRFAEIEWTDLAGKADPKATLWTWAWSRFPALVHEGLPGVNETRRVRVNMKDGTLAEGYPDNRETELGLLVLLGQGAEGNMHLGPFSIDEIQSVEALED